MVAAAFLACGAKKETQSTDTQPVATTSSAVASATTGSTANLPPDHPPIGEMGKAGMPGMPPAATEGAPMGGAKLTPASGTVSGEVLESVEASGFNYIRLRTSSGEVWAAVRTPGVKKGAKVTVIQSMAAEKFVSKSLGKTFDHLIFGDIEGAAPPAASASPHGSMAMPSMGAEHAKVAAGPADAGPIKVTKAEGAEGKTVAEIWSSKNALKDARVAVRGKVVKFLPGIMGKNWVHLRDGSGSHDKGDDDITVTTLDTVAVGDVVVAKGTVHLDKDFGAGYRYPVIIEDAKVNK